MRQRRGSTGGEPLRNRLALLRFVCREFGYEDAGEMLGSLARAPGEIGAAGGESEYFRALYLTPAARVTRDRFAEYDANIGALSRRLRMTGEHGRTWKPHQYLALLFTEHYLRRYFDDTEALRADLNQAKSRYRPTSDLPDYRPDDLRTLAFQSATGSGKTLLMHAHILQYRHYLAEAGGRLNNVVLVTPNEQMSAQHERELRESDLHARVFSSAAGSDLFAPVEIIDVNKLAQKKGVKRVAVRDFGDDNLVLVDEGHLGATGKVWRERRRELSRGGFTFEYSATFNQVATNKDPDLLHAYGKCLLFDYPYRRFHEDGYGKDYAILNLPGGVQDGNADMYLLGCLLTFYQQLHIWRDGAARWREFHPAKPLWVFLGKTVTGSSKADRATRSDVVRILRFLGRVLARGDTVRPMIARLLAGQSGLLDDEGRDFFDGSFPHLPRTGEDTSRTGGRDLRRPLRDPVPRRGKAARRLPHRRRRRAAPSHRRPRSLRGGQRRGFGRALPAAHREPRQRPRPGLRRRPRDGLRGAAVPGRGPAGLDGERGHRRAPLHRGLELLAGEHDGAHARRGGRGAGDHPDVRARGAPEGLEHEPEALPRERRAAAAGRRPAGGAGEALRLRAPRQLHADLPGAAATRRGGRGARDVLPADHLELRAEDRSEAHPAEGRPQVRSLRRTRGVAGPG